MKKDTTKTNKVQSIKDKFKKSISNKKDISLDDPTPKFYLSTGNKIMNKIISGRYDRGFPQGRIAGLAGPSGAGKSFIMGNVIKQAQKEGYMVVVVDSENAMDTEYLGNIGVDTSEDNDLYIHISVSRIASAVASIKSITEQYHEARKGGFLDELPRLLIIIDSLDFLFTDSMLDKFEEEGELGNDQGLHAKKLKQMLSSLVSEIKHLPGLILCAKQVYVDQTPNANPPWKFTESLKFAFTQILLVTRLLDKDEKTKEYNGIRLRVFGFKVRNSKPFQRCEIKVPYDTGLDEYEGILPVAVAAGIVEKNGSWYSYKGNKWQGESRWTPYKEDIYREVLEKDIIIDIAEGEEEGGVTRQTKDKKVALGNAVNRIKERKDIKSEVESSDDLTDDSDE